MQSKYPSHALELHYLCMGVPTIEEVKELGGAVISLDYKLPGIT